MVRIHHASHWWTLCIWFKRKNLFFIILIFLNKYKNILYTKKLSKIICLVGSGFHLPKIINFQKWVKNVYLVRYTGKCVFLKKICLRSIIHHTLYYLAAIECSSGEYSRSCRCCFRSSSACSIRTRLTTRLILHLSEMNCQSWNERAPNRADHRGDQWNNKHSDW